MLNIRTIDQLDIKNKTALVRVDYNIPLNSDGSITDDKRIRESLPTLLYLLKNKVRIILITHLGDPDLNQVDIKSSHKYRLDGVAQHLSRLIGQTVSFIQDDIGSNTLQLIDQKSDCSIFLLNNLRFNPNEKNTSLNQEFTKDLRSLADVYINDAFSVSHRLHTSVTDLPKAFSPHCCAGFLMEKELRILNQCLLTPKKPFLAIIGGAKISSKIGIIEKLSDKCDQIAIVGAMAFTFLKALGYDIGSSIYEESFLPQAVDLLKKQSDKNQDILLPEDFLIAKSSELENTKYHRTVDIKDGIPQGYSGVDIGPKSIAKIYNALHDSQTLFWNGPAGIFEIEAFSFGTRAIANLFASHPHTTIVGGGDSAAAIKLCQVEDKINHISTGGGACLKFIEKETLPGIDSLK